MRVCGHKRRGFAGPGLSFFTTSSTASSLAAASFRAISAVALLAVAAFGQGAYEAQVRGVITDQSGAVVAKATVTITNVSTNVAQTASTNEHGEYFFTGLRPATYTVKTQASGFRIA